jgi:hypothetical protein
MLGAIAVKTRRLHALGRDGYINAGRQDGNIWGHMVVMGVILDACVVEQAYESQILIHAGLPPSPGVEGALMPPPMAHPEVDGRRGLADEIKYHRRLLQWAIQQEAEQGNHIDQIQVSAVTTAVAGGRRLGT